MAIGTTGFAQGEEDTMSFYSNRPGASNVAAGIILTVLCVGCDPISTTIQPMRVVLEEKQTGERVAGAFVQFRRNCDSAKYEPRDPVAFDNRVDPAYVGATDKNGMAQIFVQADKFDPLTLRSPPSDIVRNSVFDCLIVHDSRSENCQINRPKSNTTFESAHYRIHIDKVWDPSEYLRKPPRDPE